jgi:hypothetical protein
MADLYKLVPKELNANLRYRLEVRKRCATDDNFRRAMWTASKHDILLWMNLFAWAYEPRPKIVNGKKLPHTIPFITWPHQDPVILTIKENLGYEDIGVEKSRGEGASWIAVLLAVHDWIFEPMSAIGFVSRNEQAVDNPEDPDSLMWKFDWELTKLPKWMAGTAGKDYKRSIAEHTNKNLKNGATVAGYAATGDVASGGRKKWFLMDELAKFPRGPDREAMASTQPVTNSRLIVSTPKGSEGAYFEVMHEPSSMVKVTLDWRDNPTKNRGLYKLIDGKPVAEDPVNNPLPDDYNPPSRQILDLFSRIRKRGFKLEGRLRSPWYDHECDRPMATPQNIAQELDRDYGGSMHRIFGHDFFAATEKTVRRPMARAIVTYDHDTLKPQVELSDDGPLLLWLSLDNNGKPPVHPYVLGADVATGLGGSYTSNSVLTVIDQLTMEQVAELASNTIPPHDFADLSIAICKWFYDAYLAWEANGPGAAFSKQVLNQKYGNIQYRSDVSRRGRKKTKEVGWWTDTKSKQAMFGEIKRSVTGADVVLRSDAMAKECGQYVVIGDRIEHILSARTEDDSSRGQAHGDRVMAYGVALMATKERPLASKALTDTIVGEPPPHTMAARQKDYEDSMKKDSPIWDDRDNFDLAHGELSMAGPAWK